MKDENAMLKPLLRILWAVPSPEMFTECFQPKESEIGHLLKKERKLLEEIKLAEKEMLSHGIEIKMENAIY